MNLLGLIHLYLYWMVIFVLVCESESALKHSEDSYISDVLEESLSFDEEISQKQVILAKGETIKLECQFPASQSWSYIQWIRLYKEGQQFKHDIVPANRTFNNGSLTISSIVLSRVTGQDTANYSCVSTSASGTSSMDFYVAVKDKAFCYEDVCKPHGRCIELLSDYYCECNDGYMGEDCNIENPCFNNPCLNNGSCTIVNEGFNCSCAEGFKGEFCEREACVSSSCNGGGSCSETADRKVNCTCRSNRAGKSCEHTCTFSSYNFNRHYCSYGRTCVIQSSGYERCQCENRVRGNHCMMRADIKDECSQPNICNNRGRCYEGIYQFYCECNSYAHGKNCEYFNECIYSSNHLCDDYGGTCVDLPQGYKCTDCPEGQSGDKCQYKKNPCTVICRQSSMEFRCDERFLNYKLRHLPIYLNSRTRQCGFGSNFGWSKHISYQDCGTELEYVGDEIIYRNSLYAGLFKDKERENDVITRLSGNFQFDMECRIPVIHNESSVAITDYSLRRNESMHLQDKGKVEMSTRVYFRNYNWDAISKYTVGERLYVELMLESTTSNQILSRYGFLKPVTCYATPDSGKDGQRYVLLEDGCIKDDTFRYENRIFNIYQSSLKRRAYFSFESFSFKGQHGKLYLHCTARFCINKTDDGRDFGFEECQNMCTKNKEQSVNKQTSAQPTTTNTMSINDTRSTAVQSSGLFGRMKRAILGQNFQEEEHQVIERNSGKIVHFNDVYDSFI